MYSLFWYLLTFLMKKITTAENIHPQRREVVISGKEDCFYRALALWRVKQAMRSIRRSVSRVPVCFRKIRRISSCYSAIFNFFNAKFSRVIFLGWSNWLIMVVYCYCQIPSNATLNNQCIRRNRLVASCSLGGLFPEKLYHLDISNKKGRLLLNGLFQKASCPSTAN